MIETQLLKFIEKEPDRQLANTLYRLLGSTALQYSTKPVATPLGTLLTEWPRDHTYARLRDSVAYRADCAYYHYKLLENIIASYDSRVKKKYIDNEESSSMIRSLGDEALYVFDDIVFHSVSIFDYIASFIGFPYLKELALELNWNGLVRRCRVEYEQKDSLPKINDKLFSYCVSNSHDTFINKLQEYRAQLYHHRKDFIPHGIRQSVMDSKLSRVNAGAPKNFVNVFSKEFAIYEEKSVTLLGVSSWIYDTCLNIAVELARLFFREVGQMSSPEPFYNKWNRVFGLWHSISLDEIIKRKSKKLNVKPARRQRRETTKTETTI